MRVISKTTLPLLFGLALLLSATQAPAEMMDHYKAVESNSAAEAYANLAKYNERLEQLLEQEQTLQTVAEIHRITYTLEKALHRLEEELEKTAETLEELHLGSERADTDVVTEKGRQYLDEVAPLVRP